MLLSCPGNGLAQDRGPGDPQVGPPVGFSTTLFFSPRTFENSVMFVYMADIDMRELLKAAGLSQAEFARRVQASVNTVNAWCSGRNTGSLAYRLACMWLAREAVDRQVKDCKSLASNPL